MPAHHCAEPDAPRPRPPVDSPTASFLAVAASTPPDFATGAVIVLLDEARVPVVAVAVDGAPEHDLTRVCELVTTVRRLPEASLVRAAVVAVVRSASSSEEQAIAVGADVLRAWAETARLLRAGDVELLDVLVLEPSRWMSAWENAGFGDAY